MPFFDLSVSQEEAEVGEEEQEAALHVGEAAVVSPSSVDAALLKSGLVFPDSSSSSSSTGKSMFTSFTEFDAASAKVFTPKASLMAPVVTPVEETPGIPSVDLQEGLSSVVTPVVVVEEVSCQKLEGDGEGVELD